jgi:uncharacterized protein (DUF427 family)
VWDYPRPPRVEAEPSPIRVVFAGVTIAETTAAHRVLETSHPPVYYLPPADVRPDVLEPSRRRSFCEFKGAAHYWSLRLGDALAPDAAWSYPDPAPGFEAIRDHLAFYPSRVEACFVGEERVRAQPGDFYGGWITTRVVGPFKGAHGTRGW